MLTRKSVLLHEAKIAQAKKRMAVLCRMMFDRQLNSDHNVPALTLSICDAGNSFSLTVFDKGEILQTIDVYCLSLFPNAIYRFGPPEDLDQLLDKIESCIELVKKHSKDQKDAKEQKA